MSDIGDDVVVLRHPGAAKAGSRGAVALLALVPVVAALAVAAADGVFSATTLSGHMPLSAGLIMLGGFLASAFIALPGLLMLKREQLTEELHVGSLGMELRQTQPRTSGAETVTCWRVLWSDVTQAKLRYRDAARPYYAGVDIHTHGGLDQRLYPSQWQPQSQPAGIPPLAGRILNPDADALRATHLVKTLSAKGLQIEDDVERPQDRLAARLGLGLAAAALVAALIFDYFVEH